jgi:phosphatidate cytidylyltransferase
LTKIRALSALVAAISVVVIIFYSGYAGIAITTFFISLRLLYEYSRMTMSGAHYRPARIYFILLGLTAFTLSILKNDFLLHSFILSTLLLFIQFLLLAKKEELSLEELVNKIGLCTLGILYAGVCPVYISLTARLSDKLEWFAFALLAVFAGDTAAYFVGIKFGKTRLFSRISPNKSIEGAIASLFATVLVGFGIRAFLLPQVDLFLMLALCICTSIVAQTGDLCESMIKRSFNAKDSGQIMPGHGGLLDRLDGVLFAAPVVYIFVKYLVVTT